MNALLTMSFVFLVIVACAPEALAGLPIPPVTPPVPRLPGVPEVNPSILSFIGSGITLAGYKIWKKLSRR